MNTALPEGEGGLNEDFLRWREFIGMIKEVPVPGVIGCYCPRRVALIDMVAYAAPFPGARYQAGVRRFPIWCRLNRIWLASNSTKGHGNFYRKIGKVNRLWPQACRTPGLASP